MTILHGDARFYNNIFVQTPVREDLTAFPRQTGEYKKTMVQFVCGTHPYDGYPTAETYFSQFTQKAGQDGNNRDIFYDHLPVYTGGNVYFNGAQPCDSESDAAIVPDHTVTLELADTEDGPVLKTDLYRYLPARNRPVVSTELLGIAFEPEQAFEQPDGSPIVFDQDYYGAHRGLSPLAGPFARGAEEFRL